MEYKGCGCLLKQVFSACRYPLHEYGFCKERLQYSKVDCSSKRNNGIHGCFFFFFSFLFTGAGELSSFFKSGPLRWNDAYD